MKNDFMVMAENGHVKRWQRPEPLTCDYCGDKLLNNGDHRILYSGKKECWRCQFYFKDKYGKYQIKTRYFKNKQDVNKFMDNGEGHWILNPEFERNG